MDRPDPDYISDEELEAREVAAEKAEKARGKRPANGKGAKAKTVTLEGIEKRVVTMQSLNERYAILHTAGAAASMSAAPTSCQSRTMTSSAASRTR
jgi:hypothetical protein